MLSWINALQLLILGLLVWFIADTFGFQNPPKIKGLLSIPGYPIVGNLLQVLQNPSLKYSQWSTKYNESIFQIRLGCIGVVVVNKYADVENLWTRNVAANNSRPLGYTFHDIVSSTQGLTVGSSPFGQSYIKKKKAISSHMNQTKVDQRSLFLGQEANAAIKKIITTIPELSHPPSYYIFSSNVTRIPDIDLMPYLQKMVLKESVYMAYGIPLDCYNQDSHLAAKILNTESEILHLRSLVGNLKDYIPILRPLLSDSTAESLRSVRDEYMDLFWTSMVKGIEKGDPQIRDSIVGQLYVAMQEGNNCLTIPELKSVCLSLVSAGLDNTPLNYNHLMGILSQPVKGLQVQEKAYDELMKWYKNDLQLAWKMVEQETSCSYITAMVLETLRIFTVLPLALPRALTKDVLYKGILFPKGSILIMNAYHANHDPEVFEHPYDFIPERWINTNNRPLNHFSFGAGARMCSGNLLAFKQLYVMIAKTILMFYVKPPQDSAFQMKLSPFEMNENPKATSFEPKLFKVRLEPRCTPAHECLYRALFHMH